MYIINLKVTDKGILETFTHDMLHLGTKGEKNSVTLKFDVDPSVEGDFKYVKFVHSKSTVLQRVLNGEVVISSNVFAHDGTWKMSYISSNAAISYDKADGSYIFSTVPIDTQVSDGLLDVNILDEEQRKIEELDSELATREEFEKNLIEMRFDNLVIPNNVESIGNYFLYNASKEINKLTIGENVVNVGQYAFYGMNIRNIDFSQTTKLETFDSYAFSHVSTGNAIILPKTLTDYGHYCFQGGTVYEIRFEDQSSLKSIGANAFNGVNVTSIYLPVGLQKFAANGYIFRSCSINKLWIPNTMNTVIPQSAFYKGTDIKNIELQEDFNVSANFSNVSSLTRESILLMFERLKDRNGMDTYSITLGSDNLAKVTDEEINVARLKNWAVS